MAELERDMDVFTACFGKTSPPVRLPGTRQELIHVLQRLNQAVTGFRPATEMLFRHRRNARD